MITIDANILIRYIVEDDAEQAALAARLLEQELTFEHPGLVSTVAMHETCWALRRVYRFEREAVANAVSKLLDVPNLVVERADEIAQALAAPVDFADGLIHFTGKAMGASKTLTFDKGFARLEGVELLA